MIWGGIAQGIKSQLIVVEDNMIAVRLLRDEILRSVAILLVQQRQLILQLAIPGHM